jgi:hypothetical protein
LLNNGENKDIGNSVEDDPIIFIFAEKENRHIKTISFLFLIDKDFKLHNAL